METSKDRILKFSKKYLGIGQNQFETKCGISNGYISKLKKGSMGADIMNKISKVYPNLNLEWVVTGEGEMIKGCEDNSFQGMATAYFHENMPATAGDGEQPQIFNEKPTGIIRLPNLNGAKHIFPVVGCSMMPRIKAGDLIGVTDEVALGSLIDPDNIYLIITTENQRMIKHIGKINREEETITCVSENENYAPFKLDFSEIYRVYQVVFHLEVV